MDDQNQPQDINPVSVVLGVFLGAFIGALGAILLRQGRTQINGVIDGTQWQLSFETRTAPSVPPQPG